MNRLLFVVLLGVVFSVSYGNNVSDVSVPPPEPTDAPQPTDAPSPEPTKPTVPPTKPTVPPTKPTVPPTKPTVPPTNPTVPPTKPTVPPTKPTVPPTNPTVPPTKPTLPPTKPTLPPTKPTAPPTKPTNPPTKPTDPTPPEPPKPTPPQPPKPVEPTVGLWQVNYTASNISCLMVKSAIQVQVPYTTTTNHLLNATINVPPNATVSGYCGNATQQITLQWNVTSNNSNKIVLNFAQNLTAKIYKLDNITILVNLNETIYPNINGSQVVYLVHDQKEFGTSVSKSYRCMKKQVLNLTDATAKTPRGTISVDHLQLEAFVNSTNHQFTTAEDCASADTPDVVPIAVGCALAALVIIVLIAYLIGRRRRQARGYLSM